MAEGTRLLSEYGVNAPSRVRIPPSPLHPKPAPQAGSPAPRRPAANSPRRRQKPGWKANWKDATGRSPRTPTRATPADDPAPLSQAPAATSNTPGPDRAVVHGRTLPQAAQAAHTNKPTSQPDPLPRPHPPPHPPTRDSRTRTPMRLPMCPLNPARRSELARAGTYALLALTVTTPVLALTVTRQRGVGRSSAAPVGAPTRRLGAETGPAAPLPRFHALSNPGDPAPRAAWRACPCSGSRGAPRWRLGGATRRKRGRGGYDASPPACRETPAVAREASRLDIAIHVAPRCWPVLARAQLARAPGSGPHGPQLDVVADHLHPEPGGRLDAASIRGRGDPRGEAGTVADRRLQSSLPRRLFSPGPPVTAGCLLRHFALWLTCRNGLAGRSAVVSVGGVG